MRYGSFFRRLELWSFGLDWSRARGSTDDPEVRSQEKGVPLFLGKHNDAGHANGVYVDVNEGRVHHFWWSRDLNYHGPGKLEKNKWIHIAAR